MARNKTGALTAAKTAPLLVRLWREYLARYWPQLALALVAMAVYAVSASAIPIGVEWINAGFTGEDARFSPSLEQVLVIGPLLVIGLGVVNALAQYIQARLSMKAALAALRDIQNDMFARLIALDLTQLERDGVGQSMSRFTNDVTVLRETLQRASNAVRDLMTLLGLCAMMVYYDWVLFMAILAVYPIAGWPVAKIGKILRASSAGAQQQAGDITALVGESVQGARMVKTYQIEPLERARAADAFEARYEILNRMAQAKAANEPFIFFVGSVALGLVVAVVAMRINAGALAVSEFVGFIIALLLLSQPARGLGTMNAVAQEGLAAFERMLGIIDARPAIASHPDAADLPPGPGVIRFRGVDFSYDNDAAALQSVSLDVSAGAHIALVGESGAGKSTLINLLPRLYEPTAGSIEVDGVNIQNVSLHSLRARMALVSQDAVIFNMSALENIAFGRPGASRAEIIEAAEAAAANDFIANLPGGYDAPLGEGGAMVSGGQRQRIALARAFLKDAPILLLDEATSALDAENEARVQEAIERLMSGRTTLVIAHRLSTVKSADQIVVMAGGQIVETGDHDELIAADGIYAKYARLQLA